MPSLTVTYPAGALAEDRVPGLADALTTAFLRWAGAPDTAFARSVCWVELHEVPAGRFFTGGVAATEPAFRLVATVPAGAFSPRRFGGLVEELTRLVLDAAGMDDPMRVWVVLAEVPDGRWGAGGRVVDLAAMRAAVAS